MKIFISHSSKNKDYGNIIVELLRSLGVKESEIIFTSNVAYGIPIGQNIFNWLKSQIENKPYVIYLLSEQYYKSVACLNEMGAAWIIENNHAAIFTPDFNLNSKEFQTGALDPREIGFYINDEDRINSWIQQLSMFFDITTNNILISQSIKKFLANISSFTEDTSSVPITEVINMEQINDGLDFNKSPLIADLSLSDKYSEFLKFIKEQKFKTDELLLFHYLVETGKVKLMTGWQQDYEISKIKEWEKIHDIKPLLSQKYPDVLNKMEIRGFTEVSETTSYGNPKEISIKEEISKHILDLPEFVLATLNKVAKDNYYEHPEEDLNDSEEFDLPF
ncbi:toll/interleukin-1 receptor domain-containing protein [Marinoscillum pacificum]|uniref:toll/interleukin-1 receptor domain-containing protein n=1 Tax=Marinoscillum pacificum TaxID=392723 RepID=UPI00215871B3|nr:toll/interleukin-1 receptor domain-containing protein [Marinoscillum pacificum]